MFENLSEKLQRAFKNLRGQGKLSEENIGDALREIRLALLEADVNVKVVKELIDHVVEAKQPISPSPVQPTASRTRRMGQALSLRMCK